MEDQYKYAFKTQEQKLASQANPDVFTTPSGAQVSQSSGALVGAPITSASLQTQTPITPVTPETTPTFPVSSLTPEPTPAPATLSPEQTEYQKRLNEIMGLNTEVAGEEQFRAQEEQRLGVEQLGKTTQDFTKQLKLIQAEAAQLDLEAQTTPSKIQEQFAGRAATRAGVAPLEASELRKIQIKRADVASRALITSALLDGAQGDLVTALTKIDSAVAQKYNIKKS